MTYDNIATIVAKGRTVLIRRGDNNDWAAYWLDEGSNVQSGNLDKLYRSEREEYGVNAYMAAAFPHLTYRP